MTGPDIHIEYSAASCNVQPEDLRALRTAGVPDEALDPLLFGLAPIQPHRGGLFDIAAAAAKAVIVPAGWWDGINWHLEDLVAFYLDRPDRWWRRLGAADVLGPVNTFSIEPRRLHTSPLDWLADGGRGLCLLDWGVDPVDLLAGADELVADRFLLNRLRKTAINAVVAQLDRMVSHG